MSHKPSISWPMIQPFCPQMLRRISLLLDPHTMTDSLHSSSMNAVLVRYQLTRRSISYLLSFPRIPKSMIGQKGLMKSILSKNGLRILRALDQVALSRTLLAVVNSNHRRDCRFLRDLVASQGEKNRNSIPSYRKALRTTRPVPWLSLCSRTKAPTVSCPQNNLYFSHSHVWIDRKARSMCPLPAQVHFHFQQIDYGRNFSNNHISLHVP
ncbi:hypothetical protein V8E52_003699 [Russula decolorans]